MATKRVRHLYISFKAARGLLGVEGIEGFRGGTSGIDEKKTIGLVSHINPPQI
jgi:hypothetical protein